MSTESAHRWAAVAISHLDDAGARRLAEMPILERLDAVCELFSPPPGQLTDVWAVRGPICADCRVSWEDVHADDTPWPCPGRRPDALGGTLLDPPASRRSPTRQQRRAKQRKALKGANEVRRVNGVTLAADAAIRRLKVDSKAST